MGPPLFEVGVWGASRAVYYTITKAWKTEKGTIAADPTDASLGDAYEILELTSERLRYRSVDTDDQYTLLRVADTFELPAR